MNRNRAVKPTWTAADRARHKAIREAFADCPTPADLHARGDYEGPIKGGAFFAVRTLIHELKQARQAARLTLAMISKTTGMDQATLSRLEKGRQPNPTVDTLWRYAKAVGRRLHLSHQPARAKTRTNGRTASRATG